MKIIYSTLVVGDNKENLLGVLIDPASGEEKTLVVRDKFGFFTQSKDGKTITLNEKQDSLDDSAITFPNDTEADDFIAKLLGGEITDFVNADAKAFRRGIQIIDSEGNKFFSNSAVKYLVINKDGDKADLIITERDPVHKGIGVETREFQICKNTAQVDALKLALVAKLDTIAIPTDLPESITSITEIIAVLQFHNLIA